MTNRSKILALSLAALTLAACTTTSEQSTYVEPQAVGQAAVVSIRPDAEYVSRVEQMARNQGIQVRWVNVPSKRIVAANQ
jgi:uncharacterized lipoprotein YajG